jgi:hypothetical protein
MRTGILLFLLGVVCYICNILLIKYYLKKRTPGILEMENKFPDDSYAWEHTAGTGAVPSWVSYIGLIGIGLLIVGVIFIIISFLIKIL